VGTFACGVRHVAVVSARLRRPLAFVPPETRPTPEPGARTISTPRTHAPTRQGLYDPRFEHDACGVAFVVHMKGHRSHELVKSGIEALCNLDHRGARGAEPNTGDGAGMLIQMPSRFFRSVVDFGLPAEGSYASGLVFLPDDDAVADRLVARIGDIVAEEGMRVLGWRDVPTDPSMLGAQALAAMPRFRQVFVAGDGVSGMDLERGAYVVRKRIENTLGPLVQDGVYIPSLSGRTFVYKGMLIPDQLPEFFTDLRDDRIDSALALMHSRFSTNTFPSWPLAHPYRYISHNGEINTVQGNRNWMRAREALLESTLIPGKLERIFPICDPAGSDSASFDEVLELLHMGGYSLPHAVLMMIPEAWERHQEMDSARRDFYRFHGSIMEPWDGPASIAFTDGSVIGAVLDRNGLRPSRYVVTSDDLVIMASEVGVLDVAPDKVVLKGRLQPGRMFLVDTAKGRIVGDDEIKAQLAAAHPYGEWLHDQVVELKHLSSPAQELESHSDVLKQQQTFGYTTEELRVIIEPMARDGVEPTGSMGTDTPIAVLSSRPRLLFDYFQQLFAQVTNPPLDAIREELVTALGGMLGPERNLLSPGPESCRQIFIEHPVITNDELRRLVDVENQPETPEFRSAVIPCLFPVADGAEGLRSALDRIRERASLEIAAGAQILILSDRGSTRDLAPIPSLLSTSAVHHHLIREKTRTRVGLVVEAGDARECHHMCLLIGYGAAAINPYLAFETIEDMIAQDMTDLGDPVKAIKNYIKACDKGILKVMSKMGISTVASYTGAQIFEAIGLAEDFVDEFFTGTVSRLAGIGVDALADECIRRHRAAYPLRPSERAHRTLDAGGEYQWRREGEFHLFNPETVFKLQHSTRTGRYDIFKEYTRLVDDQAKQTATLRGLFQFRFGERPPVPIEEVEPVSEIVTRFSTGAMSYGSISAEAHENLAIAMNRIGGRSNSGEGGEHPSRFTPEENGDWRISKIKQVASGRFGVTSEYLVNATDLQIKMAQGAKPGEGGQLPGKKVWPWIAEVRYSTPGVGLISPPPHHDIYSIEDLAQLIHDLKNANPEARVHVKLVAQVGVGTVAAGVSKAHADVVLISGHDGGTGASPLTSIKHAGAPWELGLAETQQTLLLNRLRDRIVVQVDGQMKTGRDVMIAALLGGEEFGFATAPLVVSGCVMMRVCHLDTCPVGIATQDPVLRQRFSGKPEFVVHFMEFIAEEVRELLAELGFRSLAEAIGHSEMLDTTKAIDHWKAANLDLSPILAMPEPAPGDERRCIQDQDHGLTRALDIELIQKAAPALDHRERVNIDVPIRNVNRTVGTLVGQEISRRWGEGLPEDTVVINFSGSAGQSFGAFAPRGLTLRLNGDANDYTGKGLSGGRIIIKPPAGSRFAAEENIIAGNVILYGATGGEVFLRGVVGERFCVRNSGAIAVVEGVGDHGCEYMTGGRVVVLGPTGRNFGAGMSGGIAYVWDPEGVFARRVNMEMVDLDPLEADDRDWLRDRIARHYEETASTVAESLIGRWDSAADEFVKVMPKDFKRVLAERAAEDADPAGVMAGAHD
jgi:glutamate synthase (NADPH/NADH) large chain